VKILQVISGFPPAYSYGGALKVAYDISKGLAARGHTVTVYTTDVLDARSRSKSGSEGEVLDGIRVFRFRNLSNTLARKNLTCAPGMFPALCRNIKNFDIIHVHEYRSFQAGFVHHCAVKNRVPYLLQAHGSLLPFFEKEDLKKIFDRLWGNRIVRDAAKFIAVSKTEEEQYLQAGIPKSDIEIVRNSIDPAEYRVLPEPGTFRQKYGIPDADPIVLSLGRLHPIKGIDFLVRGFAAILPEFPGSRLVIAGPDEGMLDSLQNQVKQLAIADRVIFTGPLAGKEKLAAYRDADLLVYPGRFEIFGLVPLEAIMCGTPVIVSEECGCRDVIEENGCGYLVTYGDLGDLREKIGQVLREGPLLKKRVLNGRHAVSNTLSMDSVVSHLERVYENCLCNL
jgi:glycosyltransferase involved in cell wall biosynthesis